jgi:hypothetical protein
LESTEQLGPEIHELALAAGLQALLFKMGGTHLSVPQGGSGGAAVAAEGQAIAQSLRAGASIPLAQAGCFQKLAGVHSGDAVDTADLRKGQPFRS